MHAGSEIVMSCLKLMTEELAEEFVENTNALELGQGLQKERDDHLGGYSKIEGGFDKGKGSHFVKVTFYMEIEDMLNVEKWCAEEGFELVSTIFGRQGIHSPH